EDSLKARFCTEGNRLLYELCKKYDIPYRKTGKLIVANTQEEKDNVESLFQQGKKNGVSGLELLSKPQIKNLEPNIRASFALFSHETGIINTHQLMRFYETQSESNDVTIAYQCEVLSIQKKGDLYTLDILDSDGEHFQIGTSIVINSAGVSADKIASMAGIDIDKARYQVHPCKGEYFSISNRHSGTIKLLIYPTPSDNNLGIHATLRLDGTLTLGPNAFYVNEFSYDVDAAHQEEFFNSTKEFLPFLDYGDISPEMSGIRAKLQAKGEPFRDFIIQEESEKGLPGLINLIGIESPGLTASPAIAEYVENLVNNF
ncbi:MAG: NAD(P)/FAD-dependent oxidoreductase, partial [Candidatus Marinimicrobia bacterium]|nr:NAD(P)/FAD-dependent oxidoreductase [Candidatus Neomarinimicrobiota bacterium]